MEFLCLPFTTFNMHTRLPNIPDILLIYRRIYTANASRHHQSPKRPFTHLENTFVYFCMIYIWIYMISHVVVHLVVFYFCWGWNWINCFHYSQCSWYFHCFYSFHAGHCAISINVSFRCLSVGYFWRQLNLMCRESKHFYNCLDFLEVALF